MENTKNAKLSKSSPSVQAGANIKKVQPRKKNQDGAGVGKGCVPLGADI